MKKIIRSTIFTYGVVALLAFLACTPSVKANTETNLSVSDIIELLISLDIIPSDKADTARNIIKEKTGTNEAKAEYCIALSKNLYMGVSDALTNGEVSKLQKFLKESGDYEYPEITGYFGPATEMAVQKWQAKMKIITSGSPETTGFGVVGPMTRSKMICAKLKEQNQNTEEKKSADATEESTVTTIVARADDTNDKVFWAVEGISPLGYKVVWSKDSGPTYPTRDGDKYLYVTGEDDGSKAVHAFDGSGTYYVRVCEYLNDGTCGEYSNEVTLVLVAEDEDEDEDDEGDDEESGDVTEIELTVGDDGKVSWDATGYSDLGYKVVWSLNTDPTYPTRSGDKYLYFSDPDTDSAVLEAFKGTGRYHVRVCEYLGGKCGLYSDEEVISL